MNHKQLAEDALDVAKNVDSRAIAAEHMARAQVHATLALADQHRTANLLAVCTFFAGDNVKPDTEYWTPDRMAKLGQQFTEGLGL